jgi:PAS domain S-box-containing protein
MKYAFSSLSVRVHLIILIALVSLPLIVLIIYTGIDDRNQAIKVAKAENLKFVGIVARHQQTLVTGVEQLVTALSLVPAIQERDAARSNPLLVRLCKINPQLTNIALLDETGSVWGTAMPFPPRTSLADRKYFLDAMRTGKFASGEFTIGRASGKPILNFGYPIKDRSDKSVGVIGAAFDLSYIYGSFKSMHLPAGSSFNILDRTGITLYTDRGDPAKERGGKQETNTEIFSRMKEGPDEGTFEARGKDGVLYLVAYQKMSLSHEPQPYLYLFSGVPRNAVTSAANATMMKNTAALLLILFAGVLLVWFIGKHIIVRPIRLLRRASQQLAEGARSVNVSADVRGGEFGELATAFDTMAEALVRKEAAADAAEAALRESERKFRVLAEESVIGINLVQDGVVRYVNQMCADIAGYTVDEITDKMTLKDLILPEDLALAEEIVQQHKKRMTRSAKSEVRIRRKDGGIRYVEAYSSATMYEGKPAVITSVVDITERRKADDELRHLTLAIEQATEDVIITDPNGIIQYVNPAFEKVTGYSRAEVIGKSPRILKSGAHDADFYTALWRTITGGLVWTGRLTNRRKDGQLIQEDATISPLIGSSGEITGFLSVKRDVTDEVKLQTQFYRAQKMEAVGTLAAGIAHDFNNILSGILGHATLLQFDMDKDHPHFKRLHDIEHLVMSGADLTKQLLGFARGGKYEVRATNLNEIVEKTAGMFGRTEKGIRCNMTLEENVWLVDADQGQIEQVLMNMLINASQAMSREGNIHLETQNVELDEADVRPYGVAAGRYVRTSITDTGVGMDKATQERIFEPFFTTKSPGMGTGLGLASAYGIVKHHEGFISVYSEPGRGTSFKIYLPASAKEGAPAAADRDAVLLRGHETILVVDDEKVNISLIRGMLEKLGYTVLTADSGEEAVKLFMERGNDVDLVILDMIMPGMSGKKVFQVLRAMNPSLKVLLASGYSLNGDAQQLIDQGCSGFIQKPFRVHELSKKIRDVL